MIIGFSGPAGSGKDTCADYLVSHHAFRKLAWAGPLKAGLAAMGLPEPADRDEKEKQIPGFSFSWRQAVQRLGTEWGRHLDNDIWVKMLGKQIAAAPAHTDFVISDVRFENEAAMIRQMGGVVVHLYGRAADLGAAAGHASEAGLVRHIDDMQISNHKDMAYLTSRLDFLINVRTLGRTLDTLEKSADQIDTANQLQEHLNEAALAGVRAKAGPQSHPEFDGEHCLECDIDMPTLRLQMGRIRCVQCESAVERQNKLRGK